MKKPDNRRAKTIFTFTARARYNAVFTTVL
jgi:hypothetical protein